LRPEGLAALAKDEQSVRELLSLTVGKTYAEGVLARRDLTFEDSFILMELESFGAEHLERSAGSAEATS